MRCTSDSCIESGLPSCNEGNIYNSEKLSCQSCSTEFGTGVRLCDEKGATHCEASYLWKEKQLSNGLDYNACTEIFDNIEKCNGMYPSEEGKYGPVCVRCTDDSCIEKVQKTCPDGKIYNGNTLNCETCANEFGAGTELCSRDGATQCSDSHFLR